MFTGWIFLSCFLRFSLRLNVMSHFWHWTSLTLWWISLMCLRTVWICVNVFEQNSQECRSSLSWCTLMWLKRCLFALKVFGHLAQENFLVSVWTTSLCMLTSALLLNFLSQISHGTIFSSECTFRMCVSRCVLCENLFPQTSQLNGFSPVCALMWKVRVVLWRNFFGQISQPNFNSSVCRLSWVSTPSFLLVLNSQNLHLKSFSLQIVWWLSRLSKSTNLLQQDLHLKFLFNMAFHVIIQIPLSEIFLRTGWTFQIFLFLTCVFQSYVSGPICFSWQTCSTNTTDEELVHLSFNRMSGPDMRKHTFLIFEGFCALGAR